VTQIPLAACPSCARHVRVNEPACPFCRVELPSSFRAVQAPLSPAKRLSRAALYALRVGTLSATAVACGGQFSAAERDNDGAPDESGGTVVAVYGAPIPVDAGVALDSDVLDAPARLDSAVPVDASVDDGSTVVAADGGPIFVDSGKAEPPDAKLDSAVPVDASANDGSTVVAAYGGPIFVDSGKAERDAIAVPYGVPPIGG
jgi:hypothetical protein